MNNEFTAQIIRTSADGIAGLATARLFEQDSNGLVDDFSVWKEYLREQVVQLSAALQAQNPNGYADHVAWTLVALQGRGISTQTITLALRSLDEILQESVPSKNGKEISPYLELAHKRILQGNPTSESCIPEQEPMRSLANGFLEALRSGEELQAIAMILDSHATHGLSVPAVVEQILIPSLHEMGRLWHLGQATVAEEHFVTQASQKVLAQLLAALPPITANGRTAVLSGVAGEDHSFGIQVVAGYLQMDGWRTICLGSNTPPKELAYAARDFAAEVVLLGATMDVQIPSVMESIQEIRTLAPAIKILVGGSAFANGDELCTRIGADLFARNGAEAVRMANGNVK